MSIKVRAKNFDLLDGLKEGTYAELEKISDLFHSDTVFDVLFVRVNKEYKCEIKVQRGHDFIRSEEKGKTAEFALLNSVNTLKKRMYKLKNLLITKKRKNLVINQDVVVVEDTDYVENLLENSIQKRKYYDLKVLTEEEAIINLESLDHDFYIFKNKDIEGKTCVLYRRNLGYGLIETN